MNMKISDERLRKIHAYTEVERRMLCSSAEEHAWSICSLTTDSTATSDDLPGTGRILDMHFYQPVGRKIDMWMERISLKCDSSRKIASTVLGLWGLTRPLSDYPAVRFDKESYDANPLELYISEGRDKNKNKIRELLSKLIKLAR